MGDTVSKMETKIGRKPEGSGAKTKSEDSTTKTSKSSNRFGGATISDTRTTAKDWKAIKSFTKPTRASWNFELKPKTTKSLIDGFCPAEMEDKWFIYSEGPNEGKLRVYFYRSWTGHKIFELLVEGDESRAKIVDIEWETNKKIWNEGGKEDVKEYVKTVLHYL